jgi:ELWxxDGT repeat protein
MLLWLRRWLRPHSVCSHSPGRRGKRFRPALEMLETRTLPATFTVSSGADAGPGSLRQAIVDANNNPGPDQIVFNLGGGGAQTISPATALPALVGPVVLDATTQPGFAGTPLIELNGAGAGAGADGLVLGGSGAVVRGLVINRFGGDGIEVGGSGGHMVVGNWIGTNSSGGASLANGGEGVNVVAGSVGNTVGGSGAGDGNVLSGNALHGLSIASTNNRVLGNRIGTNPAGSARVPNALGGILITGSTNTVGGTAAAARNVISGNDAAGLTVTTGSGNVILGNLIGTDANGTAALPNLSAGVSLGGSNNTLGGTLTGARNVISGNAGPGVGLLGNNNDVQGNYIGTNAAGTAALPNTVGVLVTAPSNGRVGGTTPAARNVISGNSGHGVDVAAGATLITVQGNYIGTNAVGTGAVPNGGAGVNVDGSLSLVGGLQPGGLGNVIAGNVGDGVRFGPGGSSNRVLGNRIGTDANGAPLGNGGHGVLANAPPASIGVMVGTTTPGEGNVIAYNAGAGVFVAGGIQHRIVGNSIFANGGLGIDLAPLGVNPNDPGDADTGPNNLQNYPVLSSAVVTGAGLVVRGLLNSNPGQTFFLDFYASAAADPTGYGEGAIYLGSTTVTTNSLGDAPFTVTLPAVPAGQVITATATGGGSNTSEFSRASTVLAVMQVQDINARTGDSAPSSPADVNGTVYFAADDGVSGRELWKSNGTTAGTVLVKNIAGDATAVTSSNPRELINASGLLYFFADDEFNGPELWRSDGTTAGTQPVTNFLVNPAQLTSAGGTLFFVDNGNQLYQSNGVASTTLITTLGSIQQLRVVGNRLYFRANTAANGTELYEYDGATVRLIDIVPGSGSSNPSNLTAVGNTLFFTATTPNEGTELFRLNAGVPEVFDIVPGSGSSNPANLANVGGVLYFSATTPLGGTELYLHDGAVLQAIDIVPGSGSSSPSNFVGAGGAVYFRVTTPEAGTELARYDSSGVTVIDVVPGTGSSNPAFLTAVGGTVFFRASTPTIGLDLFKVQGTTASLVADIVPGTGGSSPASLTASGSQLFFTANNGFNGIEPWFSDGTAAGTRMPRDINLTGPGSGPSGLTNVGGVLYFSADDGTSGRELWRSDGTATTLIDVVPGAASSNPTNLTDVAGTLYFTATPGLYRLSGTTPQLIDSPAGSGRTNLGNLTNVAGTLYFTATTAASGTELYKYDGATFTLIDIVSGAGSSNPVNLTAVGGILYFTATTPANGTELYRYDGSTLTLLDIVAGSGDSNPANLVNFNGVLFFTATTPANGTELYRYDGTTLTLIDLAAGTASSNPANLTPVGGTLFFTAFNGAAGVELWKSNGTPAGTAALTDFLSGPSDLIASGGALYFLDNGQTLYRSDGTTAGTVALRTFGFGASNLADVSGLLFFAADDAGPAGRELWKSDGTAEGTALVSDIFPGRDSSGMVRSSAPANLTALGGTLFFSATDQRGTELWKVQTRSGLVVTALTPTATGFVAQFSGPVDPSVLNLYDATPGGLGPADVTLTGPGGAVAGSLVVEPSGARITFLQTGGVLAPGTYTVMLRSAANGFRAQGTGELLDGNGDGTPGGDYLNTFTVTAPSTVVVSIPDFMRGPGQAVDVPATSPGLPLRLSASAGVTSVNLTLRYDPNLLTITGASVAPGLPAGATVTIDTSTPGAAVLSFSSPALPGGLSDFVRLSAAVPLGTASSYALKQVLDLTNVQVNGSPAVDDDGLMVVGYFGDTTGNGTYSSLDATRALRVAVGLDSGFAAYQLADPVMIADVTGNGTITSLDATRILQAALGIAQTSIPPLPPNPPVATAAGPDPLLSLPRRLRARRGATVTVPVNLRPSDGLEAADLVFAYDMSRLELRAVRRGSLTRDFDLFVTNVDPAAGTVRVGLGRTAGPIHGRGTGSGLLLAFRVRDDAPPGRAVINLRQRLGGTATQLNEGGLVLHPAPSDRAGDRLDGLLRVVMDAAFAHRRRGR